MKNLILFILTTFTYQCGDFLVQPKSENANESKTSDTEENNNQSNNSSTQRRDREYDFNGLEYTTLQKKELIGQIYYSMEQIRNNAEPYCLDCFYVKLINEKTILETTTGSEGRFSFHNVPAGEYVLYASNINYDEIWMFDFTIQLRDGSGMNVGVINPELFKRKIKKNNLKEDEKNESSENYVIVDDPVEEEQEESKSDTEEDDNSNSEEQTDKLDDIVSTIHDGLEKISL